MAEHRWYFYQATFGQNSGHFTLTIKECITIALCMQSIPVVDSVHVNLIRGTSVGTQNNKSYLPSVQNNCWESSEQVVCKFSFLQIRAYSSVIVFKMALCVYFCGPTSNGVLSSYQLASQLLLTVNTQYSLCSTVYVRTWCIRSTTINSFQCAN